MKFLCSSCKAKYQIADEKVIGRTVKMKCRQCGHIIEINQALIDSGGATLSMPPPAQVKQGDADASEATLGSPGANALSQLSTSTTTAQLEPKASGASQHSSAMTPVEPSAPMALAPRANAATSMRSHAPAKPARQAPVGTTPTSPRQPEAPAKPSAPKPAPRVASPVATDGDAKIPSEEKEPVERKSRPLGAVAKPERRSPERSSPYAAAATPVGEGPAKPMSRAKGGGQTPGGASVARVDPDVVPRPAAKVDLLAGAFTKAVEDAPAQSLAHPLAGDEWYVGIGDQPVGPIRLAEIRERASRGEITQDCLVWRDGFEDWRALSAFPELVAVVEDGIASARSLVPPPGAAALAPLGLSRAETGAAETAQAGGPILAQTAVAAKLTQVSESASASVGEEPLEIAGVSGPKVPMAAWAAVAMALVLGVTIGIVFIKPEPPKQIIKYVEVPAKQSQSAGQSVAASGAGEVAAGEVVARPGSQGAQASNGAVKKAASPGGGVEASPVASAAAPQGLKGLSGLRGLGPSGGPQSDGATGASSGSQLDSATLSRTVSRYTPSVKRSCWQPALDMRSPDAPTTARVTARITVGPSGKVQSVSTSGDPKGYSGLASCIQTRVRNWEFPPAGGSTEVNVPFVFAAQ